MGRTTSVMLGAVLALGLLGGCQQTQTVVSDPVSVVIDRERAEGIRRTAARQLWDDVEAGRTERSVGRESLKRVMWDRASPARVRMSAVDALIRDTDPEGEADTAKAVAYIMHTEHNMAVVEHLCELISARGWTQAGPAIARNAAWWISEDEKANDALAHWPTLRSLHPGEDLESILFGVFADADRTAETAEGFQAELAGKTRGATWELLARLDPTGETRRRLLAQLDDRGEASGLVAIMRTLEDDLGVVPVTASELDWAASILDPSDRVNSLWYERAVTVVGALEPAQREGLRLRHLEPIVWASSERPALLAMSHSSMAEQIRTSVRSRKRHERRSDGGERISTWRDRLPWGDLLAMLVVDEALADPGVVRALVGFAERDRGDTSTEYGGTLTWTDDGWEARLYPPRMGERFGDDRFVAPREMFEEGDRSLAHFHLQAQEVDNSDYAGPSGGDFIYARTHARTCVVVTTVGEGLINVDWYRGDGAAVDLGQFGSPVGSR